MSEAKARLILLLYRLGSSVNRRRRRDRLRYLVFCPFKKLTIRHTGGAGNLACGPAFLRVAAWKGGGSQDWLPHKHVVNSR